VRRQPFMRSSMRVSDLAPEWNMVPRMFTLSTMSMIFVPRFQCGFALKGLLPMHDALRVNYVKRKPPGLRIFQAHDDESFVAQLL